MTIKRTPEADLASLADPVLPARVKRSVPRKSVAANLVNKRGAVIGRSRDALPHAYGPAMSKLTPLQQRFCQLTIDAPLHSNAKLLIEAGYKGSANAGRKMYRRLMSNPIFCEARQECAKARMLAIAPKGVDALDNMVSDPKHKDHLRAVNSLLDRTGYERVTKHEQKVTVEFNREALIARIAAFFETNPDGGKVLNQTIANAKQNEAEGEAPSIVADE